MTKIRPVLLWLLLVGPFLGFSQIPKSPELAPSPVRPEPTAGYADRQAAFMNHRLTGQVEPQKKQPYEPSIGGHPVSLPSPTPFQTQNLCR